MMGRAAFLVAASLPTGAASLGAALPQRAEDFRMQPMTDAGARVACAVAAAQ